MIVNPLFLAIVGPTASGKSALALELAKRLGGEIVCCDSVQLYRGFDIGSSKPTPSEQREIKHHLFDAFAWDEPCDAAVYAELAQKSIAEINSRGKLPIVTGGSGLYFRALVQDNWDQDIPKDDTLRAELRTLTADQLYAELKALDPVRAHELHVNDRFRVSRALEINKLTGKPVTRPDRGPEVQRNYALVVLDPPRVLLNERIGVRTSLMLEAGLVNEVKDLLASGVSPDAKPMNSIGYLEVQACLRNKINETDLGSAIETSTRQYARRQTTWFKKVPRDVTLREFVSPEQAIAFDLAPLLVRITKRYNQE